jgi:hypothetical protein
MSLVRTFVLLQLGMTGLVWPLAPLGVQAQTVITPSPTPVPTARSVERDGRVVLSDEQAAQAADSGLVAPTADRQKLPLDIRVRIQRFEVVREAYLKEQALLRKRLTGAATEEERERIRNLIQDRRAAWLAQARKLREEAQDRLRDLQRLMPDRREILQNARDAAKDRRGIGER